jgi:hypothetical protein
LGFVELPPVLGGFLFSTSLISTARLNIEF